MQTRFEYHNLEIGDLNLGGRRETTSLLDPDRTKSVEYGLL